MGFIFIRTITEDEKMNNILKMIRIAVFTTLGLVLIMTFGCELAGDDNSKPISNAGLDQIVKIGTLVTLDGNGSDDDGDDLIFSWSFDEIPLGSSATLSDVSIINPTFTIDKEGLYIVNLTVFDGSENSAIDIVTIFAEPWTTKSPMPSARQSFATSVVNGKIYAIGGAYTVSIPNVSFTYYDVPIVEEYDPATDTWTTKISMPTTYRSQLAVGVVNDKIYVIGGEDGSESLSLVEEYEPN